MILYSNLAKSVRKQLKSLLDHNIFVKIKLSYLFKLLFLCLFKFIYFFFVGYGVLYLNGGYGQSTREPGLSR